MKQFQLNIILLFILAGLVACNPSKTNDNTKTQTNTLQQEKEDLLSGVSKAVCYSGFRNGQHPDRGNGATNPSYEEILEDLNILSYENNFGLIRVYDSGVNSEMTLKVIRENNINIKVMLGIWLRAEISNHENCAWLNDPIPDDILLKNKELNIEEINRGIKMANEYKNIVVAVNVGNEALVGWSDHLVNVDTVISYLKKVKKSIKQPVTVAENYEWWADYGVELAKVVDFVSVHTYPVWEDKDIDEGMSYTIENMEKVRNALPNSKIVITEAGWATVASEFRDRASEEKQMQYYNEVMDWAKKMNITTFFFEAFDEDWKGNPINPLGAEKHWGLFTVDRKPKKVMHDLYPHLTE